MNDVHDMVGAYALDALSDAETQEFRAHLASCEPCRIELAELTRVVDVLPLAVDQFEPPTGLRDRILAEIAEGESDRGPLAIIRGGQPVQARPRGVAPWQGFAAAAAAVVIAATGGWTIAKNTGTTSRSGGTVLMASGPQVPAGVQVALVQPRTGTSYFLVHGMRSAPAGKVYELWLIRPHSTPVGAGVFTARNAGAQAVPVPVNPSGYSTVAVTVEPGPRGSSQPTTKPIMAGRLTA